MHVADPHPTPQRMLIFPFDSDLFGAGTAFPEHLIGLLGNVECAARFFKFVNFSKRVVLVWVEEKRPRVKSIE